MELAKNGVKPATFPALDLLDDRDQLAAVLRLDLEPGDPRYDLARSRAVIAKRTAERKTTSQSAKKKVDDAENAYQRANLENKALTTPAVFEEWQGKLRDAHRDYSRERAAVQVLEELDNQAREAQRQHPGATLAKNNGSPGAGQGVWAVDRRKFPFAGQWIFDYGVLTLHQDTSGHVAGVFATKVFHYTATFDIDGTKPTTGSAILVGNAKGATLRFTMFDYRGNERTGTLVLDADGTGGKWTLDATDPLLAPNATKTAPRDGTATVTKQPPKKGPRQPNVPAPGTSPFRIPPGASPFGLTPPPRKPPKGAEGPRNGSLDRLEVAAPDPSWTQTTPTASVAGYWVHSDDKRMNILFKAQPSGLFEGAQATLPGTPANLRAATSGQVVLVLENVNTGIIVTPSVREAVLADGGEKLRFLPPRDRTSTSGLVGRNATPLELTRDGNE